MEQELLSIGIDVGTSTTQVVFCSLHLEEEASYGRAPHVKITDKKVIYRSKIWNTVLSSDEEIDGNAVARIVKKEYETAGFLPENVHTGAVIITGESARKRNAKGVMEALSRISGEFVSMEAGPDLESVLAGKGAGADLISLQTGKIVANIDIGGGTTNICLFQDGKAVDCACLNVGGRLLRVENNKICKIEKSMQILLDDMGFSMETGVQPDEKTIEKLCHRMCELLEEILGFKEKTALLEKMTTNHGLTGSYIPEILTFSGGVADCFCSKTSFAYGDFGDILGRTIARNHNLMKKNLFRSRETIRSTVIGAGSYSVEISGSTIDYQGRSLPLKNLPVITIPWKAPEDIPHISEEIEAKKQLFSSTDGSFAIWMEGDVSASFEDIEHITEILVKEKNLQAVILEKDLGKALGQALKRKKGPGQAPVCIDEIYCSDGDYIDVGKPIGRGNALQVVIKTLVFG